MRRLRRIFFLPLIVLFAASLFADEAKPRADPAVVQAPRTESLLDRVIALNQVQEPELDRDAARKAFDALIEKARAALAGADAPRQKIEALNKVLLGDRKVSYLSNMYWRDATIAASLLRGQGNCLSTSTLYVLAGDALKLPIHMVLIPGHAFARWDDGKTRINIETTSGGRELPDEKYMAMSEAAPEDVRAFGWCESLDNDHFMAEMFRVSAAHRVGENRLEDALSLLDQAAKLAPNRSDMKLWRCQLMADITGRRTDARGKVLELLNTEQDLPPSVKTGAILCLAKDAAGQGDHQTERMYLLKAFAVAPKSGQDAVLQSLAFCHRALKDYRGAVRYMELAAALMKPGDPNNAGVLYNLAILQKNDGRLDDALASIRMALKINPESWNLQVIEAGYMVLKGDKDEGMKKFVEIKRPRGDVEFFEIMVTWFYAVYQDRAKFYSQFEKALSQARATHILEWIDQDVDLDVYRKDPEFKALVEKHAKRLRGE